MVVQVAKDLTESKLAIAGQDSDIAEKRTHIRYLICQYLSFDILDGLVQELPKQFQNPRIHHWRFIDWAPTKCTGSIWTCTCMSLPEP